MSEETNGTNDHDLLIELRTEMRGMRKDITDLKDNIVRRVENLEGAKISKDDAEKMILDKVAVLKEETELKAQLLQDKITLLQRIVFGCVSVILLGFVGGLVTIVYNK